MLSASFGRSQGIRRMPSAVTKKNMIIVLVIVGQIEHCENVTHLYLFIYVFIAFIYPKQLTLVFIGALHSFHIVTYKT